MKRELSSKLTWFVRWVLPIAILVGMLLLIGQIFLFDNRAQPNTMLVIYSLMVLGGMCAFIWFFNYGRQVSIDQHHLYVKGAGHDLKIDFKNVRYVSATRFFTPEMVTVYFHKETPLGDHIFFYPKMRWIKFASPHPVAKQIRQLVHESVSPNEPFEDVKVPTTSKPMLRAGLIFVIVFSGFVGLILESLKQIEPYQRSLETIRTSPLVIAHLGTPISAGYFVIGQYSQNTNYSFARLSYKVEGPNAYGKVKLVAHKRNGIWSYDNFGIVVNNEYLDLTIPSQ